MNTRRLASVAFLAAAALFLLLVVLQLSTGATQHYFELVHPPGLYAERLLRDAAWLKAIIAIDDVFIAVYVGAVLLCVQALPARPATAWLAAALVLACGLLDLEENHHILAMLQTAQNGLGLDPADIVRRMEWSSVK